MDRSERQQSELNSGRNRAKYLSIVTGLSLILVLPILYYGFPIDGHDSPSQFNLYRCFSQQIWMGELYPRWLINMNDGFGSPVFFFYPPVSYYITTFFSLILGQPATDSLVWKELGFSAALAVIGAGITCYLWLKDIVNPTAAAIASIIYLIVPYHISIDLFTRGALAEVWAFVWMPLILKFVRGMNRKPIISAIGLAVSYSLLVMTHLPTALIFSLIPVAYSLSLETGKGRKVRFLLSILGMAVGVGLSDVYLLPAMTAQNYISMDPNPSSPLFYARNFLFPFSAGEYSPYIARMTILLATMILGVLICALLGRSLASLKRERLFWLVIAGLSIFMMIPLSQPIWQFVSIFQSVQFPYRFNAVLCIAYTAVTALTIPDISFAKQYFTDNWKQKVFILGTAVLCCVWLGLFIEAFAVEKPQPDYKAYIAKMYAQKLEFAEHMPKTAALDQLDALIAERQRSGLPYLLRVNGDQTRVEIDQWKPRNIVLSVTAVNPSKLTIGQFYYPGWEAVIYPDSGQPPVNLTVALSEEGLLEVQIPKESGRLNLVLSSSRTEKSGLNTSFLSILGLGVFILILIRFKKNFGLEESKLSDV